MDKILAILAALILEITSVPIYPTQAWTEEGAFQDMLRRADAIVTYQWTPQEDIATWNDVLYQGKTYFQKGQTVTGVPYTLFSVELGTDSLLSLAQFMNHAQTNRTATEFCYAVDAQRTGPAYGSCCATFISEVYGGDYMNGFDPVYDSVTGIKKSQAGVTRQNVKAEEILPGDALSTEDGGHIIWVSTVADQALVIYEQAPPVARRVVVDKLAVDAQGYLIYNNNVYNTATRSNALVHEGNHRPVQDEGVEPTCEEIGFTQGSHCGDCGLTMIQQRVISPKGHANELVERVEPANGSDGWIRYECKICGKETKLTLAGENCASLRYDDVGQNAWYHEAVDFVTLKGYMQGMTEESFGPDRGMTRGQLAAVLYRLAGEPEFRRQNLPFGDVEENTYYYDGISWAYANGIMVGQTEDTFAPEALTTREQLVTILYRYSGGQPEPGDLSSFSDRSDISPWAEEPMKWAVGRGLLRGTEVRRYLELQPKEIATRAQTAAILRELLR